jgi:large conductance mechanosensitive channel protein
VCIKIKKWEAIMLKEFKEFALKGNVVDLAVGVIIGAAFGKIVTSLVEDIFMPILSIIVGGINFSDLKLVITPATADTAETALKYGAFIQSVFDFLVVAFSIFMFIKLLDSFKKKEVKKEEEEVKEPDENIVLLTEIRDLLKANK